MPIRICTLKIYSLKIATEKPVQKTWTYIAIKFMGILDRIVRTLM